jgi:hypothetical protein
MRSVGKAAGRGVAVGILLCLCGCAGYRLGSTLPPGIRSVYVPTFVNASREPRIEADTTRAAIQEFQRDGTLRIAAREQADAVVEVTLTGFSLQPIRYSRDRALTTEEYRLKIAASMVFRQLRPESKELGRRDVEGEATFELRGDLSSSKRRALPEAARDLAHDIVESVVEYW